MQEFQCQELVNFGRVIVVSSEMSTHDSFNPPFLKIGPGKRQRVEQHLTNILGEGIAVPDTKMKHLVSAKEEAL